MKILIDLTPWWLMVILCFSCAFHTIKWATNSNKKSPVLLRISWGFTAIMVSGIAIINIIKGTGYFLEYLLIVTNLSAIAMLIMAVSLFIGLYQIVQHPDFDPIKRRRLRLLLLFGLVIVLICVSVMLMIAL